MELWDAYDKNGALVHRDLVRGQPIPDGLYHMVCAVLVQHVDGTFLLMKRDPSKPNWPNVFEAGASGSALKGETAMEGARRELREETGICAETLTPLYAETSADTHALYRGFLCVTDHPKDGITLQAGETVDYRWVTRRELLAMEAERPRVLVVQQGALAFLVNGPARSKR